MIPERTFFVGHVAAIFFQNPSNFYKVLLVKVKGEALQSRDRNRRRSSYAVEYQASTTTGVGALVWMEIGRASCRERV